MAQALTLEAAIRKVLDIPANAAAGDGGADAPHCFPELAEEIAKEYDTPGRTRGLRETYLERVLMDRLTKPPVDAPWPVYYLMSCYRRASEVIRASSAVRDADVRDTIQETLVYLKEMTVSYVGLFFTMDDIFPQPEAATARGSLQLLDSIDACSDKAVGGITKGLTAPAEPMPAGFLEDFAARFMGQELCDYFDPIAAAASRRLVGMSLLADFAEPLQVLRTFLRIKPLAMAITRLELWLPDITNGRTLETASFLGPAFALGTIPDPQTLPAPSVRAQCFTGARSPHDIRSAQVSLRLLLRQAHEVQHGMAMDLLRNTNTREEMLEWLAELLESNGERAKMQMDPQRAASHSFFVNVSALLLKLCEPFTDAWRKAWPRLDPKYVQDNARLTFDDTRLAADAEEARAAEERAASGRAAGTPAPTAHFICDCFFLTAKGMHLGLLKAISEYQAARDRLIRMKQRLEQMEGQAEAHAANPAVAALFNSQLQRFRDAVQSNLEDTHCWEATLGDEQLLGAALSFYRLVAAWLLRLVSPELASGGQPSLPLPQPPSTDFRLLPVQPLDHVRNEYLVEDMVDLLCYLSLAAPSVLAVARLEEVLVFLVVFLGSPAHVANPYLRSKMVEEVAGSRIRQPMAASLSLLVEGQPLVTAHLVESLFQLYVDIERTSRNNAFYEKFNARYRIGEVLEYLWEIPAHHAAWCAVAARRGGSRDLYQRFCHFLEADSIHLLNEAMSLLPKVREAEAEMEDRAAWAALAPQEQQDRRDGLAQDSQMLRVDLEMAGECLALIRLSSSEVVAPWFLPEMLPRIARMLNFFLEHLVGRRRKSLKLKDPKKLNWNPKETLAAIAAIYINLSRADNKGRFAAEVAASLDADLLHEAAQVLRSLEVLGDADVEELEALAVRVAGAAAELADDEAAFDEPPDEFVDPLLGALMEDPVTLPASRVHIDRASILRHLLSDETDPFNRSALKAEDLVPNPELKARIEEWKREQRAAARMGRDK